MDRLFRDIRAPLQDLEAAQKLTLHELDAFKHDVAQSQTQTASRLDLLRNSVTMAHAATTALAGSFAGIEQIFTDHEKRIEALEHRLSPPAA